MSGRYDHLPIFLSVSFLTSVVLNMFRNEKGDGANLCEAPSGPFRQISPVPYFVARFRQHDTSRHRV
jgi:hypothetical protein